MKKTKNFVAFVLALIMLCSCSIVAFANTNENDVEYIPLWMEPYSVVVYDEKGLPTVIEGGELSEEEIVDREDIAAVGLIDPSPDMIITPNTKVEYDLHGFIQNIYYLVPGTTDQYQLSNPIHSRVGTEIMNAGESVSYGSYYNPYTQTYQKCKLTCVKGSPYNTIIGTGRITFFTGTMGEGGTHTLESGDCATKMDYADVKAGTRVLATNEDTGASRYFYKYDVGNLPSAILDVWSDSSSNPITDITTNGRVDNVYNASIELSAIPYN